jgi:hypothetical protein
LLSTLLAASALGCPAPLSRGARAQEAAHELNLNARFGRTELALERVADKERDAYLRRHAAWGGAIRIADAELAGMRMKDDLHMQVDVRVAWYRMADQELRATTVRQTYQDHRGTWLLVGEERIDGDAGLLGDTVVVDKPPPVRAQFPTIRIGRP